MLNHCHYQQSISNDRWQKIESVSPLQQVRTVINQTKPLAFQFLRAYKSPKNDSHDPKLDFPQSSQQSQTISKLPQNYSKNKMLAASLLNLTKDFKQHKMNIKSSTVMLLNKSMDSIQEQISNENISQNSPLGLPVRRRSSSSAVGGLQKNKTGGGQGNSDLSRSSDISPLPNSSALSVSEKFSEDKNEEIELTYQGKMKERSQSSNSHSSLSQLSSNQSFINEFQFSALSLANAINQQNEIDHGKILIHSSAVTQRCSLFNNEEEDQLSECLCSQQIQIFQKNSSEAQEFIEDHLSYNADIFENESYNTKDSHAIISCSNMRLRNRIFQRQKRYQSVVLETQSAIDPPCHETESQRLENVVQFPLRRRKSSIQSERNMRKFSFNHDFGSPMPDNQILLPFQKQRKLTQNTQSTQNNNKQGTASSPKKSYQHHRQFSESCLPQELIDGTDNCLSAQMYKNMTIHIFSQINYIKKIQGKPDLTPEQVINFKFRKEGVKKLLIFDLDQTLIHCPRDQNDEVDPEQQDNQTKDLDSNSKDEDFMKFVPDVYINLVDPENGQDFKTGFSIRPYALECLMQANKMFEVAVYTAANDWYANPIIDHLDPTGELIQHRFFRDQCTFVDHPWTDEKRIQFFVKDLRIFKDVDPKNILIIDDNIYSFAFNLENGIPIIPFYGQKDDKEMVKIVKYLLRIQDNEDLRVPNDQVFQLNKILKSNISKSFIKYYNLEDVPEQQAQEDQISSHEEDDAQDQIEENSHKSSNDCCTPVGVTITQEKNSVSALDERNDWDEEDKSSQKEDDKSDILVQLRESLKKEQIWRKGLSKPPSFEDEDICSNDFFLSLNDKIGSSLFNLNESDIQNYQKVGDQYSRLKSFHTKPTQKLAYKQMTTLNFSQGRQSSPSKRTLSTLNLSSSLIHYVPRLKSSELFKNEIPSLIQPPNRQKKSDQNQTSQQDNRNSRNTSVTSKSIESDLDKWQNVYHKVCKNGSIFDFINQSQLQKKKPRNLAIASLSGDQQVRNSLNKKAYLQKNLSYPCVSNVTQQLMRSKRLQSEDCNDQSQPCINNKVNSLQKQ